MFCIERQIISPPLSLKGLLKQFIYNINSTAPLLSISNVFYLS